MPSPKFPATATLLDARQCPLDKFDALFAKITQERRIADGYFLQDHPGAALLLFVVNGLPYGAGRVAGHARSWRSTSSSRRMPRIRSRRSPSSSPTSACCWA
jgi:hypothetical protein